MNDRSHPTEAVTAAPTPVGAEPARPRSASGRGAPTAEDEATAHEMLRAIRRILRRVALHSRGMSRDLGLTLPQVLVLRAIGESGGAPTARDVAARVQLSPATVSGILDRVERLGLLARARSTTDRRRVLLTLTERGRERIRDTPAPLQEEFAARVGGLPASEQRELLRSLEKVVELLEAESLDAAPILSAAAHLDADAAPRTD
jgi:DNA-binding MarR family transcriptional regulator